MAWAPAMMLNSRYHWVDSTISSTQLTPSPMPRELNSRMSDAKIREEGKEAATCTTDCRRRDHFGDMPIHRPTGRVQSVARNVDRSTRDREAPPALSRTSHFGPLTSASNRTTENAPSESSARMPTMAEEATQDPSRPGRWNSSWAFRM